MLRQQLVRRPLKAAEAPLLMGWRLTMRLMCRTR